MLALSQSSVGGDENVDFVPCYRQLLNGRYIAEALIGEGSFGAVYKCSDMFSDRIVAVKIIKKFGDFVRRTEREVAMLKAAECEASDMTYLKLLEHFGIDGCPCLVFDYLPDNLRCMITPGAAMHAPFGYIVSQLIYALHVLHEEIGIVHTDIKPDNIVVDTQAPIQVQLIDFGLAFKAKVGYWYPSWYMQSRSYRSPEVLLGSCFDCKVDIWSLGCTLAEMWTGQPLFIAHDELEMLHLHEQLFGPMNQEMINHARNHMDTSNKDYHFMNEQTGEWELLPLPTGPLPRSSLSEKLTVPWNYGTDCFDQFVDLLSKMLKLDPRDRSTAADLSHHPFFATWDAMLAAHTHHFQVAGTYVATAPLQMLAPCVMVVEVTPEPVPEVLEVEVEVEFENLEIAEVQHVAVRAPKRKREPVKRRAPPKRSSPRFNGPIASRTRSHSPTKGNTRQTVPSH